MIKTLHLTNFRKVRDDTMHFTPGLNVLRGANESSKTTRLEAIAYAIGGVKACREPLAQVVTWGQPEKTLKVVMVWEFDGVEYTLSRGKSGAEITYGPADQLSRVVGQAECTAFIERLLGVSTATMSRLMLASQGAIRGALDQGPKATMQLIEELADFGEIDTVVELIQTHTVTGPTAVSEDRLARATAAVSEAKAAVPALDATALQNELSGLRDVLAATQTDLDANWAGPYALAKQAVESARMFKVRRQDAQARLDAAMATRQAHAGQHAEALGRAAFRPEAGLIERLQGELNNAERHSDTVAAWKELQRLLANYPEVAWDEPRLTLEAAIEVAERSRNAFTLELVTAKAEVKRLQGELQSGTGPCKSCGQALPNAAAVAAHNAKITAQLPAAEERVKTASEAEAEGDAGVRALKDVLASAKPFTDYATRYPKLVRVEDSAVPPLLSWLGAAPGEVNTQAIRHNLKAAEQQKATADAAAARAEALAAALHEEDEGIASMGRVLAAFPDDSALPGLEAEFQRVRAQHDQRANDLTEGRIAVENLRGRILQAEAAAQQHAAAVAKAEAEVTAAEAALKEHEFNNALLKRVRAARPIIADKLWGIVLASVSGAFSAMRGGKSVVARGANAFTVDGQSIEGLSGSTLDILGLAIRFALTRTFLPTVPFLILDEPAAAMDENRTQALLGFLVAAGFPQTLLVTHDETSETVAQNLITLQ